MHCTPRKLDHRFDLSDLNVGDWFMGCPSCWRRLPKRAAGKPRCWFCKGSMLIFDIKPSDLEELNRHKLLASRNKQQENGKPPTDKPNVG